MSLPLAAQLLDWLPRPDRRCTVSAAAGGSDAVNEGIHYVHMLQQRRDAIYPILGRISISSRSVSISDASLSTMPVPHPNPMPKASQSAVSVANAVSLSPLSSEFTCQCLFGSNSHADLP
jgi:hypothetical protein